MTPPNEHTSEGGRDDRGVPYHAESTLSGAQVLKRAQFCLALGACSFFVTGVAVYMQTCSARQCIRVGLGSSLEVLSLDLDARARLSGSKCAMARWGAYAV